MGGQPPGCNQNSLKKREKDAECSETENMYYDEKICKICSFGPVL